MRNWIIIGLLILVVIVGSVGYFSLRQELTNSQTNLNALEANYQSSQKTTTDLQTNLADLKSTLGTLQTNVANLQNSPPPAAGSPSTTVSAMVNLIPQIEPLIARVDVSGPGFKASGSGIVIRQDGYIITNQHVIEGATSVAVTLKGGSQTIVSVFASDTNLDLAILKMGGNPKNLAVATLGTLQDVVIGVSVVAAGFPAGLDLPGPASFSRGIISATRSVNGQNYVQTDATINPGSSGGGLFTLDAKLLGLTSSTIVPPGEEIDGIGLAIPMDVVQNYIQKNLK